MDVLDAPAPARHPAAAREKPPKTWYARPASRIGQREYGDAVQGRADQCAASGQIDTQGSVGPWHRDDPGHTPVQGQFTFKNADLGVFKGIDGTLSAEGTYGGSLDRIEVLETDTRTSR